MEECVLSGLRAKPFYSSTDHSDMIADSRWKCMSYHLQKEKYSSRIIVLTVKQTNKHTDGQTLLKTTPLAMRYRCAGS